MKTLREFAVAVLSIVILLAFCTTAVAAGSTVTYDGTADKFVFSPANTDMFQNFKGAMPGDLLIQDISVKNDVSNGVKVKIYLRAEPTEEAYKEFLSQMALTVTQVGDSELFSAPADQQGGLATNVCLGTFYSGAEVDLKVALDVPLTLDNEFQNSVGVINWVFSAEELPIEPTDPTPKTGDTSNINIYIILAAVSITGLLVLWLFKKKSETKIVK